MREAAIFYHSGISSRRPLCLLDVQDLLCQQQADTAGEATGRRSRGVADEADHEWRQTEQRSRQADGADDEREPRTNRIPTTDVARSERVKKTQAARNPRDGQVAQNHAPRDRRVHARAPRDGRVRAREEDSGGRPRSQSLHAEEASGQSTRDTAIGRAKTGKDGRRGDAATGRAKKGGSQGERTGSWVRLI